MIPIELEGAPGAVAEAATKYNTLVKAALDAHHVRRRLERQLAEAERDDVRAGGEAMVSDAEAPERTAPAVKAQLDLANHNAEVTASAATAATRMFGQAVIATGDQWLAEIEQAHADATHDLTTAVDALAQAAERIHNARYARGWLAACIDQFTPPNGYGRIPTIAPHGSTPDVSIGIGGSAWSYDTILDALTAWARVHEPEPPEPADCAFCGSRFRPATTSDRYCMPRCADSAAARAAYDAEQAKVSA